MARRYTRSHRTDVRRSKRGLWAMAAEPGPSFRWGVLTRRSKYNQDGTEGSTRRQEIAVCEYIRANDLGQVVAVYSDISASSTFSKPQAAVCSRWSRESTRPTLTRRP